MLAAGWHAHTLNAPGKFLVSAPEHATPRRARAYLVTDDDVSRTAACCGPHRPQPDNVPRAALSLGPAVAGPVPWYLTGRSRDAQSDPDEPGGTPDGTTPPHWKARSGPLSARPPGLGQTSPDSCGPPAWAGPPCTATLRSSPRAAAPSRWAGAAGGQPAHLMRLKARRAGLDLSVRELPGELAGIGETVLLYQGERGRPRAHRMLTGTTPVQDKLADVFGLARYAPRR